jgi:serine/threonine protein kinase
MMDQNYQQQHYQQQQIAQQEQIAQQQQHRGHKQRHRGHKQRHRGQHAESRQHKSKKGGRMVSKNRKVGRWFLGETLGKGGYSWVKKGYDRKDGRVVALKFTSKAKGDWTASQSKQIQNEIEALRQIKDKHVLQLLAYNLNAKYPQKDGLIIPSVLLVLEYLPGGELFDILYYTSALTEKIARTYFKQLMDGMEACHAAGICHRDIKPQNLLLDANFQLKIADFGLAKVFEKDDDALMRTFYVGTRGYQSPEILKKKDYTTACDIFSCGVVLFILLAGYPPFEAATPKCRWYAPLANGNAREFWKQHRGCGIPGPAKDLITRMLWYDFNKRISIRGIKKHKWYNGSSLNAKELASELRKLHRLMEIKRREDSEKQKQLQDSIKRDITRFIKIWNSDRVASAVEREMQEDLEFDLREKDPNRREEYWQGDIVRDVVDVYEAYLRYNDIDQIDILSVFEDECKSYDKAKRTIVINHTVQQICNLPQIKNNVNFKKYLDNKDDLYLELWFSDEKIKCIAPQLSPKECVTLKDIYTTFPPRYVLQYIQKRVIELGGTANIDLKNACMEAHLATHNFPAPVTIQVRIFEDIQKKCFLVKFERIGGDTLHFGRVLKQLIRKCGHCLTGVPKEQFTCSQQEREEAERLFGDNQLVQ